MDFLQGVKCRVARSLHDDAEVLALADSIKSHGHVAEYDTDESYSESNATSDPEIAPALRIDSYWICQGGGGLNTASK